MRPAAEIVAVVATAAALLSAASPHWLPAEELPPAPDWYVPLGDWLLRSALYLLELAARLAGAAVPLG